MRALAHKTRGSLAAVLRGVLLRAGALHLRLFPWDSLSGRFHDLETNLRRSGDQSKRLARLLDRPLRYLDVGARGGLSSFLAHYSRFLETTLVEPEQSEAARLTSQGYRVIDKALGARRHQATLHVTRKGGLSSLLKPGGRFLDYYRGASDRFDVVKSVELPVTTIGEICAEWGEEFDFIKLDTQGTELDVLRGLGDSRPLFVITESSFLDLYESQSTFPETAGFLEERGYIIWDLRFQTQPPPGKRHGLRQDGLPLHGDVGFMPNWRTEKGLAIISRSPRQWAALMLIYGLEDVLQYALHSDAIPQAAHLRECLALEASTLPIDPYGPLLY